MLKKTALTLAATALLLAGCDNATNIESVQFYVTDGLTLYTVNSNDSLNIDQKDLIGLKSRTLLTAIDVNPRGGVLNGLGSDGQSYVIDPATGTLTPKGTPDSSNNLANKAVEIDYNPTVPNQMVYRVSASAGENYRLNDSTSAKAANSATTASTGSAGVAGNDFPFQFTNTDANAGKSVVVSGIAYTNSQINGGIPPETTVYAIESQSNVLARLGGNNPNASDRAALCPNATNPNCGQLTTIGALRVDVGAFIGFDIASAGTSGVAATRDTGYVTAVKDGVYKLYNVSLQTGQMTFVTSINPKINPVRAFAVKQ